MIPKFISLGVETILKIICEKIIIKNIQIVNKNEKFNWIIDELNIKAESIIFQKINISNVSINIRDIILRFPFNKRFFFDNCYAVIHLRLTRDNINETLLNDKWGRLKSSIESFISMSFKSIEFNNQSIYFVPSDTLSNKSTEYTLHYYENSISLVNKFNQEKLLILNDKNISVKNLFFCEGYINIELNSKIIFN